MELEASSIKGSSEVHSISSLKGLSGAELTNVFATLPAPSPEEMHGEYEGTIPDVFLADSRAFEELRNKTWLGKAFVCDQFEGNDGQGYNVWLREGNELRDARFVWNMGTSIVDGGPAVVMKYPFDPALVECDLTDEVRVAAPGLYLCHCFTVGTVPGLSPHAGEGGRSRLDFFILKGPARPPRQADAN